MLTANRTWHDGGMAAPAALPAPTRSTPLAARAAIQQTAAPETATQPTVTPDVDEAAAADLPWVTIVWNDPVNLMSYVTYVLQKLFGYSKEKAEKLMLDVHNKGRAVVSAGVRERMEHDASQLHAYGLWATVGKDS